MVISRLWRRIAYLPVITGAGGGGGGVCWQELRTAADAMRVRIAIFMCVCVLTSLAKLPIHQTPGSGIFEINDNFCFCKQPNAFSAKTHKRGPDDGKVGIARMSGILATSSAKRPAVAQPVGITDDFTVILLEQNAQRSAAHLAVVVHIAWNLAERGRRHVELLKTTRAGDGGGMHG